MDITQIPCRYEPYRSNGFRERPSGEDKRQRRVPDEYEFLKEYSIYIKKNGDKSERIDTSVDASGTLSLLSLDFNARSLILGHQIINNGLAVTLGTPPRVSLMFSREKANGHKLYHVFYNVQFKEDSLKARTSEGSREKDIVSIEFDVFRDKDKNLIYYVIDTETANQYLIDNWFSKVIYPEGL